MNINSTLISIDNILIQGTTSSVPIASTKTLESESAANRSEKISTITILECEAKLMVT